MLLSGGVVFLSWGMLSREVVLSRGMVLSGWGEMTTPPRMTDTRLWKYYLEATTIAGGNKQDRIQYGNWYQFPISRLSYINFPEPSGIEFRGKAMDILLVLSVRHKCLLWIRYIKIPESLQLQYLHVRSHC